MIDYITVYEVTIESINFFLPIASLLLLIYSVFCFKHRHLRNSNLLIKNHFKTPSIVICAFLGTVFLFGSFSDIKTYYTTSARYKHKDFKVIEGIVDTFDPMPHEGKKYESFAVGSAKFRYSDYIHVYGFNNTSSHGGPVTRNGLNVRISYFTKCNPNDEDDNIILKLEIDKNQYK